MKDELFIKAMDCLPAELCKSIKEAGMIKLIDSKDLLAEKRVVAAYKKLMGIDKLKHYTFGNCAFGRTCENCGEFSPNLSDECKSIPGPIEKVAFEMRDASDRKAWEYELVETFFSGQGLSFASRARVALRVSTPEHQIIAAVKAWEAKQ